MHNFESRYRDVSGKFLGLYQGEERIIKASQNPEEEKQKRNGEYLYKLMEKHLEFERIEKPKEKELKLIEEISRGYKKKFRQFTICLTGRIDSVKLQQNYTKLCNEEELLRTSFLFSKRISPVKVVKKPKKETFPIFDLQQMEQEPKIKFIRRAVAAESRREFNIECDSAFRIQAFAVSKNNLIVIVSVYPYFEHLFHASDYINRIFQNLTIASGQELIDNKLEEVWTEEKRRENVEYWKRVFHTVPEPCDIPWALHEGDKSPAFGKSSYIQKLGHERIELISKHCEKQQVTIQAVLMSAWSVLLNRFFARDTISFAVLDNQMKSGILPLVLQKDTDFNRLIETTEAQIRDAKCHSLLSSEEIERLTGYPIKNYFPMVHHFLTHYAKEQNPGNDSMNDIIDSNESNLPSFDSPLWIDYIISQNNIEINMIYDGQILYSEAIEKLFQLFVMTVMELIQMEDQKIEVEELFDMKKDTAENVRKLMETQKALFLTETGIFDNVAKNRMLNIAEHFELIQYSSGDVILSENMEIEKVCVLVSGTLEAIKTGKNGIVGSQGIINPGAVFGVEAFLTEKVSDMSYVVFDESAKVLMIDVYDFINILNENPESWLSLYQKQIEEFRKIRTLWMM